jgi:hypothetical protein
MKKNGTQFVRKNCGRLAMIAAIHLSFQAPAMAARPTIFAAPGNSQVSEFLYGDAVEQHLMPVYLLGEVAKPGLYHVPVNTDLTTLLALSGGPGTESELDNLQIKNELTKRVETVNFGDIETRADAASPKLRTNDVVFVPRRSPPISNNTLTLITVVATVLTAALTGVVLSKSFK